MPPDDAKRWLYGVFRSIADAPCCCDFCAMGAHLREQSGIDAPAWRAQDYERAKAMVTRETWNE